MEKWSVEASGEGEVAEDLLEGAERAARWVLEAEKPGEVELSIALVSDATIAALNEGYLGHEGPTDVISFPLGESPVVGDVYVGLDQAGRQAEELGADFREEVLRLVIHGTLHILGWTHPEEGPRDESPMYRRQEDLLAGFLASTRG